MIVLRVTFGGGRRRRRGLQNFLFTPWTRFPSSARPSASLPSELIVFWLLKILNFIVVSLALWILLPVRMLIVPGPMRLRDRLPCG